MQNICGENMAKKKRKKVASRGSVNDIILKTLVNGDKYGYEIIKEVEEYSEGKIQLKQPSLYSSLSRFEEKGLVNSYWGDSDIGGRRHYYHLTEKGKLYYDEKISRNELRHRVVTPSIEDDMEDIAFAEDIEDLDNQQEFLNENENENLQDLEETHMENEQNQTIQYEEINSIPAFVDFPVKDKKLDVFIPDHTFHVETPIEKELENNEDIPIPNSNISTPPPQNKEDSIIWQSLASKVKINNRKYRNTKFKILYFKKSKVVILDKDGIYKLREKGYKPNNQNNAIKIIDNVGKRIEPKNFSYMNYSAKSNKIQNKNSELTEEERKIRNENFLAKFNSLTKSKMKPVEEKKIEEKPKIEIDYRKKLDVFISNEDEKEDNLDANDNSTQPLENNLFNYVDEEEQFDTISSDDENEEDKYINFEPEEFEPKAEDKKYIEEISQFHSSQNDIKINRYQNKSSAILSDKSYVLINKVKCIFGIILFLVMAFEVSLSLVIFKNNNLIFDSDKTLFIFAYIISIIIPLVFILPIFFNPNEHKINTFKLKYTITLGILTFIVSIILVYCINALLGFDLNNFKYFAVKLLLPIILTFNFVIMPPIYSALIKNKKYYD